jgi:hypothetical protein
VRLVRRGDYDVVQTLLYTKVLSRVVAEIRKKELAGWPDGPGHAESLRYVEALESVRRTIWNRMPRDSKTADRRQKLWIEFVLAERAAPCDPAPSRDGGRHRRRGWRRSRARARATRRARAVAGVRAPQHAADRRGLLPRRGSGARRGARIAATLASSRRVCSSPLAA